jgi:hypothetical protein
MFTHTHIHTHTKAHLQVLDKVSRKPARRKRRVHALCGKVVQALEVRIHHNLLLVRVLEGLDAREWALAAGADVGAARQPGGRSAGGGGGGGGGARAVASRPGSACTTHAEQRRRRASRSTTPLCVIWAGVRQGVRHPRASGARAPHAPGHVPAQYVEQDGLSYVVRVVACGKLVGAQQHAAPVQRLAPARARVWAWRRGWLQGSSGACARACVGQHVCRRGRGGRHACVTLTAACWCAMPRCAAAATGAPEHAAKGAVVACPNLRHNLVHAPAIQLTVGQHLLG